MTDTLSPPRYFYDFEFLENGRTIEPISIGIVSEDGEREYYAVFSDAPWARIRSHHWLMRNVVPHLPKAAREAIDLGTPIGTGHPVCKPGWKISLEVYDFLTHGRPANGERPELWGYFAAYDHVALAQLWGRMVDMPDGIPWYTMDLQQVIHGLKTMGVEPVKPAQTVEHLALDDAKWNRDLFLSLSAQVMPRAMEQLQSKLGLVGVTTIPLELLHKLAKLHAFTSVEIESTSYEPGGKDVVVAEDQWVRLGELSDAVTPREVQTLLTALGDAATQYDLEERYVSMPAADAKALWERYSGEGPGDGLTDEAESAWREWYGRQA